MSMENVKKFLELVKTDEGLARKVVELKDNLQKSANLGSEVEILAEKVLPLAKAHGIEFTAEEFLAYANSVSGELSDDDLLNVSGGISARGVALGLLFATGLSFVPSILSSFAEGPGGSAPAAPETSISQSYDTELEEDSAMEFKERQAEKQVRSNRADVGRAGDQVRTAQKRVDTLKSKLQKEANINDINGLSKKQKKKFSKLINQIAMAEEDLAAAQQKLDDAKEKTATTENNKKDIVSEIQEFRKAKKEQQKDMGVELGDNDLEEKHEERQDEIKDQVENKEKELEKHEAVEENEEEKKEDENDNVDHIAEADHISGFFNTDVNDEEEKKDVVEAAEEKQQEVGLVEADGTKPQEVNEVTEENEEKEEQKVEKETVEEEDVIENDKKEKDEAEEKSEEQLRLSAKQNNEIKISADTILKEDAKYQKKGYNAFLSAEENRILNSATRRVAELNEHSKVVKTVKETIESRREIADLSVAVIEKIDKNLKRYGEKDDEDYRLALEARKDEISMGKTSKGNVITVEDLKKDLEDLGLDELKEARIKQIDSLLTTYSSTMSGDNRKSLEELKQKISEGQIKEQALPTLKSTLKMIEANLKMEAEVKEKKGALNGSLRYLYNTTTKTDLQARLNEVDVNNVAIHNGQDLLASLKEIEGKIKEADTEQAKLDGKLANISSSISNQASQGKDVDALKFKLERIKQALNGDNVDLEQVEKDLKALETLVEEVKGGKDVSQVEFKAQGSTWDGTIENLYNFLVTVDFDVDRINTDNYIEQQFNKGIEDFDPHKEWKDEIDKALKAMTVASDDSLQIAKAVWLGTACGTGKTDYKHKAMLKTLALFAMELEGEVEEGKAKDFIDKVTQVKEKKIEIIATADDVKVNDREKAFVKGKK